MSAFVAIFFCGLMVWVFFHVVVTTACAPYHRASKADVYKMLEIDGWEWFPNEGSKHYWTLTHYGKVIVHDDHYFHTFGLIYWYYIKYTIDYAKAEKEVVRKQVSNQRREKYQS